MSPVNETMKRIPRHVILSSRQIYAKLRVTLSLVLYTMIFCMLDVNMPTVLTTMSRKKYSKATYNASIEGISTAQNSSLTLSNELTKRDVF